MGTQNHWRRYSLKKDSFVVQASLSLSYERGKSGQHRASHFLIGSPSFMEGESAAENIPP